VELLRNKMYVIKLVNSKSTVAEIVPICVTVITSQSPVLWASSQYGNADWMGSVAHGSYQVAAGGQDTFVVDRSFPCDTVGSV